MQIENGRLTVVCEGERPSSDKSGVKYEKVEFSFECVVRNCNVCRQSKIEAIRNIADKMGKLRGIYRVKIISVSEE